ncbi:MAG: flagellar biosynthetic protein FliR [Defluviitaleaceae bacterium]|nr:flagellar biosynthetic protein FliR [Defluviitaleaceae bacterium]MCL2275235.1 flagellar biosynthetic protein FliR [Defluviitaleaceae bacterium]
MGSLPIIAAFYEQIDVFMLVLVRTLAFFIILPIVSGMSIPMIVRINVSVIIGAAIFSSGLVSEAVYAPTIGGFTMMVVMEFAAGFMLGYMVFFVFSIILFVGHILDFMMGFAMVNMVDPLLQIQVPIVGNFFFMAVMALMIVTGGLANFIEAFVASFMVLPLGAANILDNQDIAVFVVGQMTAFLIIGVQIALPIMGALTVINVALGIMVKASPQMNVFVIGMPLKILVGLFLLMPTMAGPLGSIYNSLFEHALYALTEMIWGLRPYEW